MGAKRSPPRRAREAGGVGDHVDGRPNRERFGHLQGSTGSAEVDHKAVDGISQLKSDVSGVVEVGRKRPWGILCDRFTELHENAFGSRGAMAPTSALK